MTAPSDTAQVFDATPCDLGEGPLWHPLRRQLFWFDINGCRLWTRTAGGAQSWSFPGPVSAAGWTGEDRLLIASDTALLDFHIPTGESRPVCALEAGNSGTRSNDGRADPQGGFWIGTMGRHKQVKAGAIYRYYKGELRQLFPDISIPNAICFAPSGRHAYFTDTPEGTLWRQALDAEGWPDGGPEALTTLPAETRRPDGAVVDADGQLWIAHYGHGTLTRHAPDGRELQAYPVPPSRPTCPAFGGVDLQTLYVTSARQQMDAPAPEDGLTYALHPGARGQAEHRVLL